MKSFLLVAALLVLLAGCTKESTQRNPHEGPQVLPKTQNSEPLDPSEVATAAVKASEVDADLKAGKNINTHLDSLGKIVFSQDFTRESSGSMNDKARVLGSFNQLMLKVNDSRWLERYQQAIVSTCASGYSNCSAVRIFAQDHRSSEVFLASLKGLQEQINKTPSAELLEKYYALLGLAYDLGNGKSFVDLDIAYARFASRRSGYLKEELKKDSKLAAEYRRHNDRVQMVLRQIQSSKESQHATTYCAMLHEANPLALNAGSESNETLRVQKALLKDQIECEVKAGTLSATLSTVGAAELKSFHAQEQDIQGWYGLAEKMGATAGTAPVSSTPLLIIDRLYKEQIDVTQALELYAKIKSNEDILGLITSYAKVQVGSAIITTLKSFKILIDAELQSGGLFNLSSVKRVRDRLQSVEKLNWDSVNRGMSVLKDFLNQGYDIQSGAGILALSKDAATKSRYLGVKSQLSSLRDNMNFTIQQPLNIFVTYQLGKSMGSGTVKLDEILKDKSSTPVAANQLLVNLFTASTAIEQFATVSFVDIGGSQKEWSSIQSLQALDWAVKIGLFEYMGVKKGDFLTLFGKKQFEARELAIKLSLESLTLLAQDQAYWKRYQSTCDNPLANLSESIPVQSVIRNYAAEFELTKPLVDFYKQALVLGAMTDAYKLFRRLQKVMPGDAAEDKTAAVLFEGLEKSEKSLNDLYQKIEAKITGTGPAPRADCLAKLAKFENLRRRLVIGRFEDYFKELHTAGSLLKDFSDGRGLDANDPAKNDLHVLLGKPADLAELQKVLKEHYRSNEVQSRVEINPDLLRFSSWDTLSLTANWLRSTPVSDAMAKILGLGSQEMLLGAGLTTRLDGRVQLEQIPDFLNQSVVSLNLNTTVDDFQRQAMARLVGNTPAHLLKWLDSEDVWISLLKARVDVTSLAYGKQVTSDSSFVLQSLLDYFNSINTHGFNPKDDPIHLVSPTEKYIFENVGRSEKLVADKLNLISYLGAPDSHTWTYFDEFLRKKFLFNPDVKTEKIAGSFELRAFKRISENFLRPDYHLLPLSDTIAALEKQDRMSVMEQQFKSIRGLKVAAETLEQSINPGPFVVERLVESQVPSEYIETNWRAMVPKTDEHGRPILLAKDLSLEIYRTLLMSFHVRDTNCFYLPATAAAEAEATASPQNCQERAQQWIQQNIGP